MMTRVSSRILGKFQRIQIPPRSRERALSQILPCRMNAGINGGNSSAIGKFRAARNETDRDSRMGRLSQGEGLKEEKQ